jgi:protein-tyrosine phosphatase
MSPQPSEPLVDIHCHLLPGIDDGSKSWRESLDMARIAVHDGIRTVIATPHQLGTYSHNQGEQIRRVTAELQRYLDQHEVGLRVLPGADVRVEAELADYLSCGQVLTLGDRGKHVLLELPHELYFSLDVCLERLERVAITGILSHPERNQGLLRKPEAVGELIERGCLMQITAGSLLGSFGLRCQQLAQRMVESGWAHFVATDAHGVKARRPLLSRALARVAEIAGPEVAYQLCCLNPALVANGKDVSPLVNRSAKRKSRWFAWRQAG